MGVSFAINVMLTKNDGVISFVMKPWMPMAVDAYSVEKLILSFFLLTTLTIVGPIIVV